MLHVESRLFIRGGCRDLISFVGVDRGNLAVKRERESWVLIIDCEQDAVWSDIESIRVYTPRQTKVRIGIWLFVRTWGIYM